jgi:hypothetical protein
MWSYTLLGIYTANAKHITILPETTFNIPILSFLIIGIGGLLVY